jgi:hypothetical protein
VGRCNQEVGRVDCRLGVERPDATADQIDLSINFMPAIIGVLTDLQCNRMLLGGD